MSDEGNWRERGKSITYASGLASRGQLSHLLGIAERHQNLDFPQRIVFRVVFKADLTRTTDT